jgi:hypothetical protein
MRAPTATAAILAQLAHLADTAEPTYSAIIQLPPLPDKIIRVILQHTPPKVDDFIQEYRKGNKVVALLKGTPGTGKTSLAYALARLLEIPITHIQATEIITPLQGSGEKTLKHDLLPIIEQNPPQGHLVLIDEIDQVFGYGNECKARSVMLELCTLINMSRPNIMYIGTTNKYELLDSVLKTYLAQTIEIPNPSPEYRKAIIRVLLPAQDDPTFQCNDTLRGNTFLNTFVALLDGISIREITSIITRAKGHALAGQAHPTLVDLFDQVLAKEQGQARPTDNGDIIQAKVRLTEQDLNASLKAFQAERNVQTESGFNNFCKKGYEIAETRLLPYGRFIAQTANACYMARKNKQKFQETQKQWTKSNALTCVQMGKSSIQFVAETVNQIQQSQQQFQQQQAHFEIQKRELEKEAKDTMKRGIAQAALAGAGIGITIGTSGGPLGMAVGGIVGGGVGGAASFLSTKVPTIYRWGATQTKKAINKTKEVMNKCIIQ